MRALPEFVRALFDRQIMPTALNTTCPYDGLYSIHKGVIFH